MMFPRANEATGWVSEPNQIRPKPIAAHRRARGVHKAGVMPRTAYR